MPFIFLQAAPGRLYLGLGGGAVGPGRVPDALARLQLLVHGEEVVDLQPVVLGYVLELAQVLLPRIAGRDTDDLVVTALLVRHPEHPDRTAADQAAGERGLLDQHHRVERVAVLTQGVRYEAVVGRVLRRGEQRPVQPDQAAFVVDLVLVPAAPRDLDHDVEFHGCGFLALRPAACRAAAGKPAGRAGRTGRRARISPQCTRRGRAARVRGPARSACSRRTDRRR